MHFFTSITANYIPKARVLAHSVKRHNPGATFHLLLADELPPTLRLETEPFDGVLSLRDLSLPVPSLEAWIFKHSVVELCTAVKGQAFLRLFELTEADKVVYLDPDIAVFHPLDQLEDLLEHHDVVLTPHLLDPDTTHEAILDNELCTLKHGVYNLGFLAVKRGAEGLRFLTWWRDRLLDFCQDDIPQGLFTDQKWVDMAPALFEVHILKDRTYNVATWNICHRPVMLDGNEKPFIHGVPLKFFHFSGFDSGAHQAMLEKYAGAGADLHVLSASYQRMLEAQGQSKMGKTPCVHATFSNGEKITPHQRLLYRTRPDLQQAFPRPSTVSMDSGCYFSWYQANGVEQEPTSQVTTGITWFKRILPLKVRLTLKRFRDFKIG